MYDPSNYQQCVVLLSQVIRLFSALKDLQKILNACSAAVFPVANAFLILLIVAAVSVFSVPLRFFRVSSVVPTV